LVLIIDHIRVVKQHVPADNNNVI